MTFTSPSPSRDRAAGCFLSIELGDAPLPDAAWPIDTSHDAHAELMSHGAFHAEFDGAAQLRID